MPTILYSPILIFISYHIYNYWHILHINYKTGNIEHSKKKKKNVCGTLMAIT